MLSTSAFAPAGESYGSRISETPSPVGLDAGRAESPAGGTESAALRASSFGRSTSSPQQHQDSSRKRVLPPRRKREEGQLKRVVSDILGGYFPRLGEEQQALYYADT